MHRGKKNKNKNKNKHKNPKETENGKAELAEDTSKIASGVKPDIASEEKGILKVDSELPYIIKSSEIFGRYIAASRDLKKGEVIITVAPLVVGPCQGCPALCLGCFSKLDKPDGRAHACPGCGWAMCSKRCPGVNGHSWHSKEECLLLATAKVKPKDDNIMRYHTIVPLRCLLLKTTNPSQWEKLLTMEAHNEIRRKLPHWSTNQEQIVNRIRTLWGMGQFEEDEIHTICGILEVNAFEVGQNGISVRALYPSAFYLAHDCVPNTCHTDREGFQLSIRTASAIREGASITLSYAYTLQGTLKRREHLKESKFFDCGCDRCTDPTELGTYAGALKCPNCEPGFVLSTAPLDAHAPWKCTHGACPGYETSAASVVSLMNKIGIEVEAIDVNDVEGYEKFLLRYRRVLHPNNYHNLGIMHSLSQLYGKSTNFHINQLNEDQLKRKRDICRQLLEVINVLEPGYSRLRGMTLYELHAPIMILTQRGFENHAITKKELRSRLNEVVACLEEASAILTFEPGTSEEGSMGLAAKSALMAISEWQKIIC